MHLFLLLPIALSTLAAAGPLPLSINNALEARAPTSSTQKSRLIEPVKPRSVHDFSHADDKETPKVVLPKREFWDDVGDGIEDYLNDMACQDAAFTDDPCQKKKSRSIHDDDIHIDSKEKNPAVVLPKRGFFGDILFRLKCVSEVDFEDQCSCPEYDC